MTTLNEARSHYLTDWLQLSIALRNTSDSGMAYINMLKEAGHAPHSVELPIIVPKVDAEIASTKAGKKRKAGGDDEDVKKGGKKPKDPNAPRRPPSGYILYQNDVRAEFREKHKDMPYPEIMKVIGEAWKTLEKPKKERYEKEANEAMEDYKKEVEVYKASGGKGASPDGAADKPAKDKPKKDKVAKAKPAPAPAADESESDEEAETAPVQASKGKAVAAAADSSDDESSEEETAAPPPPAKKPKTASSAPSGSGKAAQPKASTSAPSPAKASSSKAAAAAPSSSKADKPKHKGDKGEDKKSKKDKPRKSLAE